MRTDLSVGLRGSGRDLRQRSGMTPGDVRLDLADEFLWTAESLPRTDP
jgi:hypothetical protein